MTGIKSRVNERQLDVLRWVADDCPAGTWPEGDYSYRSSAKALALRGLVSIVGHGRSWTATITEAGTYYLEHDAYPDDELARSAAEGSPSPRKKGSSVLEQARVLIKRLQDEGTISIENPDEPTRARYRRVLHACRAHHLAPEGHQLLFTGRDAGDIIIKLGLSSDSKTDWNRIRLGTRRITTNRDALRTALETSSILNQLSEP